MAWQFPVSTSVSGIAVNLSVSQGQVVNDSVFVAKGVVVASTINNAIFGPVSNQQVIIAGTAASGTTAVALGGNNNGVTVEAGGEVRSFGGFGVVLNGYHCQVTNSGLIYGATGGIYLSGVNAITVSTIMNSGTILSGGIGIARSGSSTETFELTNSGTLSAATAYGPSGGDSVGRDLITNTGRISGTILLGSGADSYSGASGHLTGHLLGGAGADVAIGGIDNDWFEGGTENDALYGNAGNDRLIGDTGNDTLNGGLGNDILDGGIGNDRLFGGPGNDRLTGGAGPDIFVFNTALNASTNRDAVTDFTHGQDKFWLENAVMTKLGAGVHGLSPAFFRAGAAAADANDYIVYNRATGVLSYDANGNAAGGAIAFASLANHPVLTAGDFLVI